MWKGIDARRAELAVATGVGVKDLPEPPSPPAGIPASKMRGRLNLDQGGAEVVSSSDRGARGAIALLTVGEDAQLALPPESGYSAYRPLPLRGTLVAYGPDSAAPSGPRSSSADIATLRTSGRVAFECECGPA